MFLKKIDIYVLLATICATSIVGALLVHSAPRTWIYALLPTVSVAPFFLAFLVLRRHGREKEVLYRRQDWQQFEALVNIHSLVSFNGPLPTTRIGATSPDALLLIYRQVAMRRPKVVAECGSGVSTILIGTLLKQYGEGRLYTIEHDAEWATKVASWIKEHQLEKFVTVIYAQLVEGINENNLWYDTRKLVGIFDQEDPIDILYIDGPPYYVSSFARYPAIPVLKKYMSNECVIIVDDADRKPDHQVINKWVTENDDFCLTWIATEKGSALLERK